MDDTEFKLEVIERLTRLETISKARPACMYKTVSARLDSMAKLIGGILFTYVPLVAGLAFAIYTIVVMKG